MTIIQKIHRIKSSKFTSIEYLGGGQLNSDNLASVEQVCQMIQKAKRVVCILGNQVANDCGAPDFTSDFSSYEIEEKYHYSPEEILSSGFYGARTVKFYDFYKKEVISHELEPNNVYHGLKRLQDYGNLYRVISLNYYGLPKKAGLKNVIELNGNIYKNWCTKCGRIYNIDYMRNHSHVPMCVRCDKAIRPGVRLYGELVKNHVMTKAVNACQRADLLIVLGTNLYDETIRSYITNYSSDHLILITENKHFTDKKADYLLYASIKDVFPKICEAVISSDGSINE